MSRVKIKEVLTYIYVHTFIYTKYIYTYIVSAETLNF